jgi:hypothetical protein
VEFNGLAGAVVEVLDRGLVVLGLAMVPGVAEAGFVGCWAVTFAPTSDSDNPANIRQRHKPLRNFASALANFAVIVLGFTAKDAKDSQRTAKWGT